MKINMWIRTASAEDDTPTMRIDYKYENRDTPVVQRYGKKLLRALGWDDKSCEPITVYESNGEIINTLRVLADRFDVREASKHVHDGDVEQVLLDAIKIVELWTVEHGDFKTGEDIIKAGGAK